MKLRSRLINQSPENQNLENESTIQSPAQTTRNLNEQERFNQRYSDLTQPAAFTSKIIKLLKNNKTHSLHARARKPGKYRGIVSRYPGNILQMDLVEMGKFSRKNNRYKYILMVIDTFSKKLYAEPIKRKTGNETVQAIKTIFSKMEEGRFPEPKELKQSIDSA